ncbi:trans-cinnamate:CoA ligase, peroxisomal-like [Corylus avellana]|uniref:trans-cinnamate:CoA ligase, peroxisomal-like n=1 Tax=Corylus avellana TaxID=13451 RepID=UPI001E201CBD|nr:trans-cinnamate:CoA ligase, peroxisomal-like [Corylus avellana]XP_059451617.1 trans-cinnamate:CoA ligase, peroxisomal-like [Corylus avellana]
MDQLPKCEANYTPLTPITFLQRASSFYAKRTSIIYEGTQFTWGQTYERCRRLASSLRALNIVKNDVVSVLAPNVPAMYEMHFAVPMAGAVLNTINSRLDAKNIATILRHSEAKVFFVDYQYVQVAGEALRILVRDSKVSESSIPLVIVIDDIDSPTGVRLGELEYEQLILKGNPRYVGSAIADEWDPIALNYTSGTTSEPKGVAYSHRGAYLSTLSLILGWEMGSEPVYLWTLPMFHCNGWTFTWGIAARGGTNVCLRNTTAPEIYRSIALHKVTHMCCAPIVFNILLQAEQRIKSPVQILTGGAPPPAALLEKIEPLGFHVTHAYGLTEATGPALVCEWQGKWNQLPRDDQAKLKARQGISVLTLADVDVKDLKTMESVPHDGQTLGEIVLRGSSIMKGYFKDRKATSEAFKGGWFVTGDVGVVHPDGYLEIKDRSKDVIISGGENISSVEVESALYKHPRVLEAAVVAMPHPHWGESPCAFVALTKNSAGKTDDVREAEIVSHCRKNLPHFMVPKKVEFLPELPKNSTGKILKNELRAKAKELLVSNKSSRVNPQRTNPPYGEQNLQAFSRL